jgi:outer membrane protein
MERIPVLLSSAVVLSSLGFMFVYSQRDPTLRLGYVESSTILNLLPAAQAAQANLDTLVQAWSDTINQMSSQYQSDIKTYSEQSSMLTHQAKLQAQDRIDSLQQQILAYRERRVGQGGQLDQIRQQFMAPIRTRVYAAIAKIARERGMRFVFDKDGQIPVVLYADPDDDITYEVLDVLNRQEAN